MRRHLAKLLWMPLVALVLGGCAVVPLFPFAYAPPPPRPHVTYVYPAYGPRYYFR